MAQRICSKRFLILNSLIVISVVLASGCKGPAPRSPRTPFVRGIRVHQEEAITMALAPLPIPRCRAAGQWLGSVGPPSPQSGNIGLFVGFTDQHGDFDSLNALDNSIWEVVSGPAVSPPCPAGSATATVPQGGGIFNFICHLVG